MPGTLYVVATPIGNLEDLTRRAVRLLGEVGLIAAEDTRTTRKLLSHLGLHTPLVRYDEHSAARATPRLLGQLEATDVALCSRRRRAPGQRPGSVAGARGRGGGIQGGARAGPFGPDRGPGGGGHAGGRLSLPGFPPRARKERLAMLRAAADWHETLVLFEAPHRVQATLRDLREMLGDRGLAVCRELTKLHEEVFRGTVSEALAHFTEPRGEFALVVEGAPRHSGHPPADEAAAREALARLKAGGATRRDAVAEVTQAHGVSKRAAYRLWLEA